MSMNISVQYFCQESMCKAMKKNAGLDLSTITFSPVIAAEAAIRFAPKTNAISKAEALDASKHFATQVRKRIDNDARVFLFGSMVKGTANVDSDIDVAVVSNKFGDDIVAESVRLNRVAREISWDIEVHTVAYADWRKGDPHVLEIQKWGVEI